MSAVDSDKKQVKEVMQRAQEKIKYFKKRTLLFIDEIHRYNKAQQDFLLPYVHLMKSVKYLLFKVENGTVILIGATTENPSFEVIGALLSRCKVVVLKKLSVDSIQQILQKALDDTEKGLGMFNLQAEEEGDLNPLDFLTVSFALYSDDSRWRCTQCFEFSGNGLFCRFS
jgi:putative ATPase